MKTSSYVATRISTAVPRLPLAGNIDLTWRCNNDCRHCWVRLPADAPDRAEELSFDEIRRIADEARALGCRTWNISGGEPLIRQDFPEIFEYLTGRSVGYSLNTNGTLITPAIAALLKRRGSKMVALYGATPAVYDHVTRNPGGFERLMRGIAYLKEAGAGFVVQLIPMRANWHQWDAMLALAKSLSPHWRVGATWLYLSAAGSPARNAEIAAQRLDPRDVIALDPPNLFAEETAVLSSGVDAKAGCSCSTSPDDDRLYASCIGARRDFSLDPFGRMTFCCFVKDPALSYNLRRGTFREAWEEFIPNCASMVHGGAQWREHCGSCERRADCTWCAAYGYLEQGRHTAPVPYLCAVAQEARGYKALWERDHRRYFRIAGITIRVESDIPFKDTTFHPKFEHFRADGPGEDTVTIRHHFELPEIDSSTLGREIYRKPPWTISRKGGSWIYRIIPPTPDDDEKCMAAVFSEDHASGAIYSPDKESFIAGNLESLTIFPTDQILLGRLLAERQACLLHSCGLIMGGQGLLIVGHSGAGKSTTVKMLRTRAEILCDDRIIVRKWPDGYKIHGTWNHGEVAEVSGAAAPLRAILFLRQAESNCITPLSERRDILGRLLACLVRPLATADWWLPTLDFVGELAREAPCYEMAFDMSGGIVPHLEELAAEGSFQGALRP